MANRIPISLSILAVSLGLAYAPIPGFSQTVVVVSGSELQEPLKILEARFEQQNPNTQLQLEFQASQDIVNNYIDNRNDFDPTVLIPANGQLLQELEQRWQAQESAPPFHNSPQPVAKTMIVAIAWPERARALFPNGQLQWQRLETAMAQGSWAALGGSPDWGSFDFVTTDPTRSNSGQLTMSLWSQAKTPGGNLTPADFTQSSVQVMFSLVKRSVYQPPRSTDILLQEFIARGPNDADVATVYESIALHRWEQSSLSQAEPYQILYLDPTIETVFTAAVVRRNVDRAEAKVAQQFVDFLLAPEQQAVFVQHGFRPGNEQVNPSEISNSPWSKNIPGVMAQPTVQVSVPPDRPLVEEVIRQWQRAN